MKQLNTYITEYIIKKKLDKPIDSENKYKYFPKTKDELINNIKELFDKGQQKSLKACEELIRNNGAHVANSLVDIANILNNS